MHNLIENWGKIIYIIGSGGHAKVVLDVLKTTRYISSAKKVVFLDQNLPSKVITGYSTHMWPNYILPDDYQFFFVAIGDNKTRADIYQKLKFKEYISVPLISRHAYVSSDSKIGDGTLINHGVIVQPGVQIGENTIVNTGARIDHDVSIGMNVHIAPGCILCGGVEVGDNTFIGAGSIIRPGVKISDNCVVQMGCVVTHNLCYGETKYLDED